MNTTLRRTLFLATPFLASSLPHYAEARSTDPEVLELRRELAAMRQEMAAMRHDIRVQAAGNHTRGNTENDSTARHRRHDTRLASAGSEEVKPVFSQAVARPNGPRSPAESRIALPEGPVQSWADFKAASAKSEILQIGGMQIGFPKGRPTIASEDGSYAFSVGLLAQEDFGGFLGAGPRGNEAKGNFNNFTQNARRLRLYFSWRYKDWVVNVTPDFGSSSVDGTVGLFEANLNYTGLRNTTLTVGYFQPRWKRKAPSAPVRSNSSSVQPSSIWCVTLQAAWRASVWVVNIGKNAGWRLPISQVRSLVTGTRIQPSPTARPVVSPVSPVVLM